MGKKTPDAGGSYLQPLGTAPRQYLVLLSALAPVMVSNVAAPVSCEVGCSDASLARGAVCSTRVRQDVAEHLWQSSGQKGWYTRLQKQASGDHEDFEEESQLPEAEAQPEPVPARPLAMNYDFLEARTGGPWASSFLPQGLAAGPVIDARASSFFQVADLPCLEWICWLLQARRLRALLVVLVFPGLETACFKGALPW